MIYIDKKKLTVDGVDVYPDHESPTQFWFIPGAVQLAQKGKRKALSYLWYTDSDSDRDGTGFLNFEVNTAVPPATLERIRDRIRSEWKVELKKITLAAVPYQSGNVSFSVLGPLAAQAGDQGKDPSVLYQSKDQLVWHAGSSSLVGDNSAVCSVKFTKEGKLAAAMKAALQSKHHSIAALYRLEFLSMRPSVTFTVKGEFKKTIKDFAFSIGGEVPLQALLLDLGVNAQWQKIMQNTDLKIEVVKYTGEGDAQLEGLKWAKQLLLDYVLKNFFEVQLGEKKWEPLSANPEAEEAVMRTKQVEEAAAEQVAEDGDDGESGKDDGKGGDKDGGKDGAGSKAPEEAVKEIVKAAAIPIPRVSIRASYYEGEQVNTIDFMYSEKKAMLTTVLPQSLVGLESGDQPGDYFTQVNRAQDPFGLPYAVAVSLPDSESLAGAGLQTLNVQARYPAGAPQDQQSTFNLTLNAGATSGANPFPFQFDAKGSTGVDYRADFVFNPTAGWDSDSYQYSLHGSSENGLIVAMPDAVAELLTLTISLSTNFVWEECDSAVVTLSSAKWKGEKRVVLQRGNDKPQLLRVRTDAQFRDEIVQYKVDLRQNNKIRYGYGPFPVSDKQVLVTDRFASHIPVYFSAGFNDDIADVTLFYEDGDFAWEDQFQLEPGQKKIERIIPVLKEYKLKSQFQAQYIVNYDSGGELKGTIKGAKPSISKPRCWRRKNEQRGPPCPACVQRTVHVPGTARARPGRFRPCCGGRVHPRDSAGGRQRGGARRLGWRPAEPGRWAAGVVVQCAAGRVALHIGGWWRTWRAGIVPAAHPATAGGPWLRAGLAGTGQPVPALQEGQPLAWGAWLAARQSWQAPARTTRYKVYAELPSPQSPAAQSLLHRYLGPAPLPLGLFAEPVMVGAAPGSERCEFYFEHGSRTFTLHCLHQLLAHVGLAHRLDELARLIGGFEFRRGRQAGALPDAQYGFSYALGPGRRDPVFSVIVFASDLAGGDAWVRSQLLAAAQRRGQDWALYGALSAPMANQYFRTTCHNMLTFFVDATAPPGWQVSLCPPTELE